MKIPTEVLLERYKDNLFAATFHICKNAADADDVVQDTFLQYHISENLFAQVMKLPEKQRIVIHLYYYEDYTVQEIAEILNLSESNVKIRLKRGRKLLKQALKEKWDDDECKHIKKPQGDKSILPSLRLFPFTLRPPAL